MLDARAIAVGGIGFGALAVATVGFIGSPAEPIGLYVPPQAIVVKDEAVAVKVRASGSEGEGAFATPTVVTMATAEGLSGEIATATGKVTVDKKRMAMLDEELLFL